MYDARRKKVYVSVNLDVDTMGTVIPRFIRWENERIFTIDQLTHKCLAKSAVVGGGGMRYTVLIHGEASL